MSLLDYPKPVHDRIARYLDEVDAALAAAVVPPEERSAARLEVAAQIDESLALRPAAEVTLRQLEDVLAQLEAPAEVRARRSSAPRAPDPGTSLVPFAPAIRRRQRVVGALALGVCMLGLALPSVAAAMSRAGGHDWWGGAFVAFFGAQLLAVALGAASRRYALGAAAMVAGTILLASALILAVLCAPALGPG